MDVEALVGLANLDNTVAVGLVAANLNVLVVNAEMMVAGVPLVECVPLRRLATTESVQEPPVPVVMGEFAEVTAPEEVVDHAQLVRDAELDNASVIMTVMTETVGMLHNLPEQTLGSVRQDHAEAVQAAILVTLENVLP